MRNVVLPGILALAVFGASAPLLAESTDAEPPTGVFRGEEIALLLIGIAGVLIGHRGSRSRKPGDDTKA